MSLIYISIRYEIKSIFYLSGVQTRPVRLAQRSGNRLPVRQVVLVRCLAGSHPARKAGWNRCTEDYLQPNQASFLSGCI